MKSAYYLLASLIAVQIVIGIAIVLDIIIVRQVVTFVYLTFVPGFLFLRILKLHRTLDLIETILFSAGLSIALLMMVGLLMNLIFPLVGISEPLTTWYLILVLNIAVILLGFLNGYVDRDWTFIFVKNEEKSSSKEYPFAFLFLVLPVLSVFGTMVVNISPYRDNILLLLMILATSVLFGLTIMFKKLIPSKFYPLALFAIALSLLFHVSLISNYIHGHDIFGEYFNLKLTQKNGYWNPASSDRLNAMLSLTVLPTIYSNVLNLEGGWILKIIYPVLFSLVPVGLYQLYKTQMRKEVAFVSIFFFMSNLAFFTEVATLARQMIGELFYVLLFLTIFYNNGMNRFVKWVCFTIFSFGLITSHYSLAYIFLFFIFSVWLISFFKKTSIKISASMIGLFATLSFAWYIYVSSSTSFNSLIEIIHFISRNFSSDFFKPQARGSQVLQGTGVVGFTSQWHLMGRYLSYLTEFLILVGFIALLVKRRRKFFDQSYEGLVFLNMGLLVMCIVVPHLAESLNMSRFFHIQLFFLAPLCILGGETLLRLISMKKIKNRILSCILVFTVIIPFFLFQTGFIYEVTGDESWSLPLSRYRFDDGKLYGTMGIVEVQELFGAKWLSKYGNSSNSVYTDLTSNRLLVGYAMFLHLAPLTNKTRSIENGTYIYLRQYNIVSGTFVGTYVWAWTALQFNMSEISYLINNVNLIYSNGGSEVYQNSTG